MVRDDHVPVALRESLAERVPRLDPINDETVAASPQLLRDELRVIL